MFSALLHPGSLLSTGTCVWAPVKNKEGGEKDSLLRNSTWHWGVRLLCWVAPKRVTQKVRTEEEQYLLARVHGHASLGCMWLDYISQPPLRLDVAIWLSPGQWDSSRSDTYSQGLLEPPFCSPCSLLPFAEKTERTLGPRGGWNYKIDGGWIYKWLCGTDSILGHAVLKRYTFIVFNTWDLVIYLYSS